MSLIWCNGQWLDPADLRIAPTDRGLMHGLGLFETILAIDGNPVFAERHLERLADGCERLGWSLEIQGLWEIMTGLLVRNGCTTGRSRIRLAVTGGSGTMGDLTAGNDRLVMMTASPAAEAPATTLVNVSPFTRNERSPLAGLKCASYAENSVALDHARRLGFEETLFFNSSGHLCEAAAANVFLVKDGALRTPALDGGCLPGVTRAVVMGIASRLGILCRENRLNRDDLNAADGIFLTSSIRGVVGVSRLEESSLPPCAVITTLRGAWDEAVCREVGK